MKKLFFIFIFINTSLFSLTFFDSLLYSIEYYFCEYSQKDFNLKLMSDIQDFILKNVQIKKNNNISSSLIAKKILLLSLYFKYLLQKKHIINENVINDFKNIFKEIDFKNIFNDTQLSLLLIKKAYEIFLQNNNYDTYCLSVIPEWFDDKSYIYNGVEYCGPNFNILLSDYRKLLLKEDFFGPSYFIFLYALTRMVNNLLL